MEKIAEWHSANHFISHVEARANTGTKVPRPRRKYTTCSTIRVHNLPRIFVLSGVAGNLISEREKPAGTVAPSGPDLYFGRTAGYHSQVAQSFVQNSGCCVPIP
jgi:hypothetical protein